MSTITDYRRWAIAELLETSPTARLDVDLLLQKVLDFTPAELITKSQQRLNGAQLALLNSLLTRRQNGEPIAYLIAKKAFMGLDFSVDNSVLIPRPDSELLVEQVLKDCAMHPLHGADIGTGSGALAIALLHYAPQLTMSASDISASALAVARCNAAKHGVIERLKLIQSDLFAEYGTSQFDFIISNPPYIDRAQLATLDRSVVAYEPKLALDGGEDGLVYYRKICQRAGAHLKRNAKLYFEIGYDQRLAVSQIMAAAGFRDIVCLTDLAGKDRVVYGVKE